LHFYIVIVLQTQDGNQYGRQNHEKLPKLQYIRLYRRQIKMSVPLYQIINVPLKTNLNLTSAVCRNALNSKWQPIWLPKVKTP